MIWTTNEIYQNELMELSRLDFPYQEFRDSEFLITGAGGLIGSYIVEALLKMNDMLSLRLHVTALCRSKEKAYRRFGNYLDKKEFALMLGDVCNKEICKTGQWDYIIHGAGNAHPKAFVSEPVETMKANIMGTMNLLDYMVEQEIRHPVKKMLLLSSGEVYGGRMASETEGWKEEDAGTIYNMQVRACYPVSKQAAETLCVSYADEYGVAAAAARLGYIYGATIQPDNTRADAQFITNASRGMDIVMKSKGTQYRSYCYLADAAVAIFLLLLKGEAGSTYNIANPKSKATVMEFAQAVADAFHVSIIYESASKQEQAGYSPLKQEILNADKLIGIGWVPRYDLKEGMRRVKDILS